MSNLILIIILWSFLECAYKKIPIYEEFIAGVKEGMQYLLVLFPSLMLLTLWVNLFISSSFVTFISSLFIHFFSLPLDLLLMAFTRLESSGKSMKFTVEEYLKCLSLLWKEIDKNYNNKDVYIPVLGSGIARFENGISQSIPKQELVDLMISSYKLSPHKLKNKNTLHIVCRRSADFSMEKIA